MGGVLALHVRGSSAVRPSREGSDRWDDCRRGSVPVGTCVKEMRVCAVRGVAARAPVLMASPSLSSRAAAIHQGDAPQTLRAHAYPDGGLPLGRLTSRRILQWCCYVNEWFDLVPSTSARPVLRASPEERDLNGGRTA